MGYISSFEELEVWQNAKNLTLFVYGITSALPANEQYGISSQLKRSVSSIATNIAEGTSRETPKDKAYFLTVAYSSAMETLNHLIIAKELQYLSEENYLNCREQLEKSCNQMNNLKKYFLSPSK